MRAAPASSLSSRSRFCAQLALEMLARQVGGDARQHFFALDRLGDVVDRAELEARHLVRHLAARRQKDHERCCASPAAPSIRGRPRSRPCPASSRRGASGPVASASRCRARSGRPSPPGCDDRCRSACGPAPAGWWGCRRRRESSTAASRCQRASPLPCESLSSLLCLRGSSDAASSRTPSKSKLAASAPMRRPRAAST